MNPTVDRQLRRAARAFPSRWRRGREDELVATAAEMLPADATAVPLGVRADIVRAGWSERWRAHPPLGHWLWYCAGGKLPARFHAWLHDDLDGRLYWLRSAVRRYVVMVSVWLAMWGVLNAVNGTRSSVPWSASIGFLVLVPLSWALRDRMRRQVRKQHGLGVAAPGGALPPPAPLWLPATTSSVAVRPLGAAYAVFGAAATTVLVWRSAALQGRGAVALHTWVVVGIAAALGGVGAVAIHRRARTRAELVVDRPPLTARAAVVHIAGAVAISAAVVAFWLVQLEPGLLFPNATLLAAVTASLTTIALGAALLRPPMTVADLVASREQLVWLHRRELARSV